MVSEQRGRESDARPFAVYVTVPAQGLAAVTQQRCIMSAFSNVMVVRFAPTSCRYALLANSARRCSNSAMSRLYVKVRGARNVR